MTLLADFESERLLNHIKTSGLLDGFTDYKGDAQPALISMTGYIDLTTFPADERACMVRLTGQEQFAEGSIPQLQYPVSIFLFGKKVGMEGTEVGTLNGLAADLVKWIRENYRSDTQCINAIQSFGKGGPFMDESRPYMEIPLIVKFAEIS